MPVTDYVRRRSDSARLRVVPPRRLGAEEFREVARLPANVNQIARALNTGRGWVRPETELELAETRNLATANIRRAARQMAATTQYAGELKRLAGGSRAGRPLAKPVYHYTLSWAEDERPAPAEMSRAVDESLKALGMEDRQAFVVAHNDTRHLHVVVNRVSARGRSGGEPEQRPPPAVPVGRALGARTRRDPLRSPGRAQPPARGGELVVDREAGR